MSLRTSISIALQVGFGNSLDDSAFEREHSEMVDTLDNASTQTMTLAESETDRAVSFDGVDEARLIYIEADGEIDVKFGSDAATPISLKRLAPPTSSLAPDLCAYGLFTVVTSALYLTNPSSTESVRVKVCIAGDIVSA